MFLEYAPSVQRPLIRLAKRVLRLALILLAVAVATIASVAVIKWLARTYTDWLWFRSLGLGATMRTRLLGQSLLCGLVALLAGACVWVNMSLALKSERAKENEASLRARVRSYAESRWCRAGITVLVAVIFGSSAYGSWTQAFLWLRGGSFGSADALFRKDIGFYIFDLPFITTLVSWMFSLLVVTLLLIVGLYFLEGSVSFVPARRTSDAAVRHMSILVAALGLVSALKYYFARFELLYSTKGAFSGAGYTEINSRLPALNLLIWTAFVFALLVIANLRLRKSVLVLSALIVWVVTAAALQGLWPAWMQRFVVEPEELDRERPYLERSIAATRDGFGLSSVSEVAQPVDPAAAVPVVASAPLWDPGSAQRDFGELQGIRSYYRFPGIDVAVYDVSGEPRQLVLGPRELSLRSLPRGSRSWPNQHLFYTHGFDIVAAHSDRATAVGQPQFLVRDIPGEISPESPALALDEPRIYFGEGFAPRDYAIVGAGVEEFDYPTSSDIQRGAVGPPSGVELSGVFQRLAYSIVKGDANLLLSDLIGSGARILDHRSIRDRISRIAPFLALDSDAYPVVVDGRLQWVLDAYTSSAYYPYSDRINIPPSISRRRGGLSGSVNYIRSAVKAVVDAYDGSVRLYVIDHHDPVVQAWAEIFPELFDDQVPEELREHLRYPRDLLSLQAQMLTAYHMTDPDAFYAREDQWTIPRDPNSGRRWTPTYQMLSLAEQPEELALSVPFTPKNRGNLIAFLAGVSGREGEGLVLFQMPRSVSVAGPRQAKDFINQDVQISRALTLLRQQGSNVRLSQPVLVPGDQGVTYVQPIFVIATGGGIPELKKVVVVSRDRAAMGDNIDDAIASLKGES